MRLLSQAPKDRGTVGELPTVAPLQDYSRHFEAFELIECRHFLEGITSMWLMLSNSFLSIVDKVEPPDPTRLLVRARVAGDIERVFPDAVVTHTPRADYAYRATLPRTAIAAALADVISRLDYGNFKSTVGDRQRHDAYLDCWGAMHDLQVRKARPARTLRR